jgi:hypothetical protein
MFGIGLKWQICPWQHGLLTGFVVAHNIFLLLLLNTVHRLERSEMKLARYIHKSVESYGILTEETVISLPNLATLLHATLPHTIEAFVVLGQATQVTVKSLLDIAEPEVVAAASVPLSQVQLQAPLRSPPKILCLGWNYVDHTAETKTPPPQEPVVFMKPHTAIAGPNQNIIKRPFVHELDYEG